MRRNRGLLQPPDPRTRTRRVLDLFLAMLQTWNNKQYAPGAFMSARELPGNKKTAGISEKRARSFFRKSPLFSPVRLRTGRPAKPACPGAACFRFLCYCGALLDKKVMPHPQWMGSGEDHPPRRGLGQRPSVPPYLASRASISSAMFSSVVAQLVAKRTTACSASYGHQ